MTTNSIVNKKSIPVPSPDFDLLKSSLKEYLSSKEEFADYDFDASVMNLILDTLSVNTYYNAFFINMIGNEAFLQTSVRRDSTVSNAKEIGYTPRSSISSKAVLYVEITNTNNPDYIDIPKFTKFISSSNGISYEFSTMQSYRIYKDSSNKYIHQNLEIFEGKSFTHQWTVTSEIISDGVLIPNPNVDTTILSVYVSQGSSSNFKLYKKYDPINITTNESEIFYLEEDDYGLYRISFGDGVLGRRLQVDDKIKIEYIVSSGSVPNNSAIFSINSSIDGEIYIQTVTASYGGTSQESIESIKFNAPKFYETQNRCVVADDYKTLLKKQYSFIQDCIAWGGEEENPPQYGRVFISIKPINGIFLTTSQINEMVSFIKSYNIMTIPPLIKESDNILIDLDVVVEYNPNKTQLNAGELIENTTTSIEEYNNSNLNEFDKRFRYSILACYINDSEESIISNDISVKMKKVIKPSINIKSDYTIKFSNEIFDTFTSTFFTFNGKEKCFIEKSKETIGVVSIYQLTDNGVLLVLSNAGTYDLDIGTISMTQVEIDDCVLIDELTNEKYFIVTATPRNHDLDAAFGQILSINLVKVSTKQNTKG